ncbi:MAG: hypothetical protein K2M94_02460 [Paramuribaculum sp.]|nr:hypothetical protein [Paramuribaculum sp.]
MKTKFYMMGAALVMLASVSFTACSDDDEPLASNSTTPEEFVVPAEAKRIKIGDEFRMPLSELTLSGAGEYHAYSLNPEVADVETDEDGSRYVAGYKNGIAHIVLSDAEGRYKKVAVAVYTVEEVTLNYNTLEIRMIANQATSVSGFSVVDGNGNYTVTSSNPDVTVSINAETGVLSNIIATAKEEAYTAVITVTDCTGLTADINVSVAPATDRVKIGESTRVALDIDPSKGEYTAESLSKTYATVVEDGGVYYVEGLKNGKAQIKIIQGATVYQYTYSVYTTDVLKLNTSELSFTVPMGLDTTNTDVMVEEGNGEYTVSSDNTDVYASINRTTGKVTMTCTARKSAYTATVTVTDCTGLTAEVKVTVEPTFDPFVQSDIDEILAKTESLVFGQVKDPSDDTEPYYFWYRYYGYGEWLNSIEDGKRTIGWWMEMSGYDYGGLSIEFPADATVGTEVSGTLAYQYSVSQWYPKYTYDGTVKLLEDNDERVVALFWNIDMDNERINRAWVVQYK